MSDRCFIDSNVLIYAKIEGDAKHARAKNLLQTFDEGSVVISIQVIGEFYNVLNKYKIPDSVIQNNIINMVEASLVSIITLETIKKAWLVKANYHYSYYDSLIIASALENNCTILYTEDLDNGQIIGGQLRICNPFR